LRTIPDDGIYRVPKHVGEFYIMRVNFVLHAKIQKCTCNRNSHVLQTLSYLAY